MATGHKNQRLIRRQKWRGLRTSVAAIFGFAAICIIPPATAQQAVYVPGNAAVTGFSGALPPAQIAPGVDPNQKTFIDLSGPSLRIVDLQHMGGPARRSLSARRSRSPSAPP